MTIETDLINAIQGMFGGALTFPLAIPTAAPDLFEAYILTIILKEVIDENAVVSYEDRSGHMPTKFIFRTSPSYLSTATQDFTHAVIRFPGKPTLEGHIGIFIAGKSGVRCESDIAILLRTEAETCRQTLSALPRHSKILLTVECKFYTGNIPLHQARSFLGLQRDISYRNGTQFLVINTPSPTGVQLVNEHHAKGWDHDIHPSSATAVTRLQNSFQKVFQGFNISRRW
jgi:hypothetical protein